MDTAQWPQEIVVKPLEEIVTNTRGQKEGGGGLDVRKSRAQKEQAVLNCPRCNSTNTKFCYYNNYSLTQPRYFCKTCRRYWTEGGSLRNIPVGGGSRKNKRPNSNISNSHTTTTTTTNTTSSSIITKNNSIMIMTNNNNNKLPDLVVAPPTLSTTNPKIHEAPITSHDLNLAFPHQDFRTISDLVQDKSHNMSSSALELLTGITNSRGFTSFMPTTSVQDPNSVSSLYTNGFSLQEFKPSLGFSLDGLGSSSYGGGEGGGGGGGRLLFPFEDLMKQAPSSGNNNNNDGGGDHDHNHNQQRRDQQADHISTGGGGGGYWTGMLGGGNW